MADMESEPPTARQKRRWYRDIGQKFKENLKIHPQSNSRLKSQAPVASSQAQARSPSPGISSSSGFRASTWRALEATIQGLKKSAELVPPLHSVIDSLSLFLGTFEKATRNSQGYQKLASNLNITLQFLQRHLDASTSTHMTDTITDIICAVQEEIGSIGTYRNRDMPNQVLAADYDEEELMRRFRGVEQLFHRLQLEISMGAWNAANADRMEARLKELKPVDLATYNSMLSEEVNRRTCTANTRKAILLDMNTWSDDPDSEKIFWLDGMAGTGKTTIACSLSDILQSRGQLAASFFCTRTSPECRDAKRIIPTIAYQLARHSSPFQSALGRALEKTPTIGSLNLSAQFEKLLKDPLLEVQKKLPNNMVVVIDALDECDDSSIVVRVLDTLFQYAANLPIKFFVTSRPEPAIRKKMMSQDKDSRSVIHLHEIERSLVQADIELYLHEELASMSLCSDQIKQLAGVAGNLFIYAATVVRYIRPGDDTIDQNERLATILAVDSKSHKKFEQIDSLYSAILSSVLEDQKLEPEERKRRQFILWTAVCTREPVPIKTLATLAGLENETQALRALQPLRSVLHVSEHNFLVSTLHASFPDYIFSQERSGHFCCDENIHSQLIARRCFEVMKSQLKFNICNLQSSFVQDHKVPDLKSRIEKNISSELLYASRYWADHLKLAASSDTLRSILEEFLSQRLLFWMEVLNLNGCMVIGVFELVETQTWLTTSAGSPKTAKLVSDAHKFVASFTAHAISLSTPHIYVSALPLSARSSSVWCNYARRMQGLLEIKGTAMDQMALAPLATWRANTAIRSVAFSPDGARIVSGSNDKRVRVWNAHDGTLVVRSLKGHEGFVKSVAFSPDGARIASGSFDRTIRVWNAHDGTLIVGPFQGHTDPITSVVFSPDGMCIVSGSEDQTIRMWNAYDGTLVVGPFWGHTMPVTSVAFSPDGERIVSGSNDRTIRVWNARDGALVFDLLEGLGSAVKSVAFSPDGTRIVSSSSDQGIRVWSARDRTLVAGPFQGHTKWIQSVAFSPDSTRIISGSDDQTIQVWNAQNGELVAGPFQGHTDRVTSVAFSPDGARIVSGSDDETIRVWNVHDGTRGAGLFQGHTLFVTSVAFSPDGARIVSSSSDKTIRMWDAHDGTLVFEPFQGHTQVVTSVVFSPDGARIVSGSKDHTIRVWDAHSAKLLTGDNSFQGHALSITAVAYSPDGACIASGSKDQTILVWSAQDGVLVAGPFQGHTDSITSVAFSPDSARIVSASNDQTIRVWNAQDGTLAADPFQGHTDWIRSVAFSPDGTRIVSGSDDQTIRVWNAHNGTLTAGPFQGHTDWVMSVAFSPDGERIVSGSRDHTIRVWDASDGTLVARPFRGHTNPVRSVTFSPDGTRIASCSDDRTIRLWIAPQHGQSIPVILSVRQTSAPVRDDTRAALAQVWTVHPNGWFVNANSELLFWVPAEIRDQFPQPKNLCTIGPAGALHVEHYPSYLGVDWQKCFLA